MQALLTQDFGTLGLALVIFVVAFCVAMPFGIYVAMKRAARAQGVLDE